MNQESVSLHENLASMCHLDAVVSPHNDSIRLEQTQR